MTSLKGLEPDGEATLGAAANDLRFVGREGGGGPNENRGCDRRRAFFPVKVAFKTASERQNPTSRTFSSFAQLPGLQGLLEGCSRPERRQTPLPARFFA